MEKDKIVEPYFSHDIATRQDSSIIKLLIEMGWEGYGLFWAIIEHMHKNKNLFPVENENLLAYDLRTDKENIHKIMNNFSLFRIEDGYYISDRISRNLNYVETKNEGKREAANTRWLLSAFNKSYEKFFGEAPILSPEEINKLVQYSKSIKNLKELLPDIIYTLQGIKFDTDLNFKPCANWLLKDNNLGRLINGEFGKLKHKKTDRELKAEQEEARKLKESQNQPCEMEIALETMSSKAEAISLIAEKHSSHTDIKGLIIYPTAKKLMEKFDITKKEVEEYLKNA